ncbi:phytanoyl-CoA dioxygenase family protein [Brevundimonas sp. TWP2-3-4b1]|uniref:phytanoyl-CoA dioxygenase family protein n=1 Tax=Brevundimonas sp. TWP2-3-4b1 TaxID=2804580 RepID=UPI003CE85085
MHDRDTTDSIIAANFASSGFATVDRMADSTTLAQMRRAYDGMLDGTIPCPGTDRALGGITRQIMHPHIHHPIFAENPAIDRARMLAARLTGSSDPQFLFSMLIYKPPGHPHPTPWHQDMSYAAKPFTPAGTIWPGEMIVQFWLALDDVDETMGCMEFIPGVHRAPMSSHRVASGHPDDEGRLLEIADVAESLDLSRAVKCPLDAGSATVHGYATPHYTGPNTSSRGRRAFIFSFADAQALARVKAGQEAH